MKKFLATGAVLLALALGVTLGQDKGGKGGGGKAPAGPGLTLTSPDFTDGGVIPNKFTQADPMPVSPKLEWTNVPAGVVSFTLIFHDPDGAPGKNVEDVLHWMAFNIPGPAAGLAGGQSGDAQLPDGTIPAKNRAGRAGFMGPGTGAAISSTTSFLSRITAARMTLSSEILTGQVTIGRETLLSPRARPGVTVRRGATILQARG